MDHRYILEPYKGISSRYQCPQCQKNRIFSRYINTETGEQLPDHIGRCNREVNCGYHYTPKQHFIETGQSFEGEIKPFKPLKEFIRPEAMAVSFIPAEALKGSLRGYENNHFVTYLISLFGEELSGQLISRYFIGSSKHWPGSTVFWQIDAKGRARSGKIMLYSPITGKRVKEPYSHISSVHQVLKLPDTKPPQCFFGEHLLKGNSKPVAIVESEKTAIIASLYLPQFVWLATGGLQNLSPARCHVLAGRMVTLFPDLNAFEKWEVKSSILNSFASLTISDLLEKRACQVEKEQGLDLADYLLRFDFKEFALPEPVLPKLPQLPPLKELINVMEYEPVQANEQLKKDPEPIENWDMEIKELKEYFDTVKLPENPLKLNKCTTIINIQSFVISNLFIVSNYNGNKTFKPYLERLQQLKVLTSTL